MVNSSQVEQSFRDWLAQQETQRGNLFSESPNQIDNLVKDLKETIPSWEKVESTESLFTVTDPEIIGKLHRRCLQDGDLHEDNKAVGNMRPSNALKRYAEFLEQQGNLNPTVKNLVANTSPISEREIITLLESKHQIILQGAPGTGKTRLAQRVAYEIIYGQPPIDGDEVKWKAQLKELKQNEQNARYKFIQFHPAYSYEDFVRGMVATTDKGNIRYEVQDKVLAEIANKACDDQRPFVLIIDEINRANLPAVLGELIYALEYRGQAVESMYAKDGDRAITLPENLLIIGTMNTADRSVGHIDYAIRRRFAFVDVVPDASVIKSDRAKQLFADVEALFKQPHLSPEFDPNDVQIGHSYFLGDNPAQLAQALQYAIKPILREYVKDGVLTDTADTKAKIKALSAN